MRKTHVATAAALAALLVAPAGALGATKTTLKESFLTKKHNARTSVKLSLTVGTATGPLAPPTTHDVDYLPAGTTYNAQGFTFCDPATLNAGGPSACPSTSLLGTGVATVAIMLGGNPVPEDANLTAVAVGPTSMVLWGHGESPIKENVPITATVNFSGTGKYGMAVDMAVPAIPTFQGMPDASLQKINVTIGNGKLVQTPKACKAHKWAFQNVMTFNDNSTSVASSTQKC